MHDVDHTRGGRQLLQHVGDQGRWNDQPEVQHVAILPARLDGLISFAERTATHRRLRVERYLLLRKASARGPVGGRFWAHLLDAYAATNSWGVKES